MLLLSPLPPVSATVIVTSVDFDIVLLVGLTVIVGVALSIVVTWILAVTLFPAASVASA